MPTPTTQMSEAAFIRRVFIVVGIVAFVAALYLLSDILLLIFGAVLVAVVLRAIAVPINRGTTLGQRFSLLAAGLGVLGLLAAIGYIFGAQISDQLVALVNNLPAAADTFSKSVPFLSVPVSELVKGSSIGNLLAGAITWGKTVFGALATLFVVVIAGIYIAINPGVYRRGFIMLFPKRVQPQISDTVDDAGAALRLWLGAQLLAMILVGVMTGAGLAFIGVPQALGLGFIAGVLEFVPYVGPILSRHTGAAAGFDAELGDGRLDARAVRHRAAGREQRHPAAGVGPRRGPAAGRRPVRRRRHRHPVRAAGAAARLSAGHRHRRRRASPLRARRAGREGQNRRREREAEGLSPISRCR